MALTAPVATITVAEYVQQFFGKYAQKGYGMEPAENAKGAAQNFVGALRKLVPSHGRDAVRDAIRVLRDEFIELYTARAEPKREQLANELFQLFGSLIDVSQRGVNKDATCQVILEELRHRLARLIVGDTTERFLPLRRAALHLVYTRVAHEAAAAAAAAAADEATPLGTPRSTTNSVASSAFAAASHASSSSSAAAGGGSGMMERFRKLRGRMADRMAGPDLTSWAGLWKSLESASGAKLLPLLTSVMEELQVARQTQQQQQHGQLVSGAALPLPDAAAAVSDAVAAILPPTAALSPVRTSKAAPDAWTHLEGPCEGSCPEVGDAEVGDVAELARRDTSTSSAGGRASSPTTAGIAARRVSKPTSGPFEYSGSSPPLGTISSTSDSALHARQHHPASSLAAATSAHTGGGGHHSVASPVSNVIDKITHRTRSVKVPADWATGEDDGAAALDANSKQTSELAA